MEEHNFAMERANQKKNANLHINRVIGWYGVNFHRFREEEKTKN